MGARDFAELLGYTLTAGVLVASDYTTTAYKASMGGLSTARLSASEGRLIPIGSGGGPFRGCVFSAFVGKAANNATVAFKVWRRERVLVPAVNRDIGSQEAGTPVYRRMPIGTGIFTLSSSIAAPSSVFGASVYVADTISFTVDAAFQALIDTLGGGATIVQAYSPADDATAAMLVIADVFDGDVEIEFDLDSGGGTTATAANGLVFLTR